MGPVRPIIRWVDDTRRAQWAVHIRKRAPVSAKLNGGRFSDRGQTICRAARKGRALPLVGARNGRHPRPPAPDGAAVALPWERGHGKAPPKRGRGTTSNAW